MKVIFIVSRSSFCGLRIDSCCLSWIFFLMSEIFGLMMIYSLLHLLDQSCSAHWHSVVRRSTASPVATPWAWSMPALPSCRPGGRSALIGVWCPGKKLIWILSLSSIKKHHRWTVQVSKLSSAVRNVWRLQSKVLPCSLLLVPESFSVSLCKSTLAQSKLFARTDLSSMYVNSATSL